MMSVDVNTGSGVGLIERRPAMSEVRPTCLAQSHGKSTGSPLTLGRMVRPVAMHRRHLLLGLASVPLASLVGCRRAPTHACGTATDIAALPRRPAPGAPMLLEGRIVDEEGATPLGGFVLDFYHTDADGYYARPRNDPREARHRGSVTTGADGRYRIETIVPGRYADRLDAVVHVHLHLAGPDVPAYWIEDTWFAGDPALVALERSGRPSYGVPVIFERQASGTWRGVREVRFERAQAERNRLADGWYR